MSDVEFQDALPTRYLDGEYSHENPSWHVEDSAWKAKHILRALALLPQRSRTICEIGCGAGEIMRQLQLQLPHQVECVGYDISPQAIKLARAREGPQIKFVEGDGNSDRSHFDVLLGIDVIEHIENPFAFLRSLRSKADYSIWHIPLELNCESLLRNFLMDTRGLYGHIHQFTRGTALATLTECGYTVVHDFYTPGYECMPSTLRTKVTKAMRRTVFATLPELSHRLISGCSLMVVAQG